MPSRTSKFPESTISFLHRTFIQQMFTEPLLCVTHSSREWQVRAGQLSPEISPTHPPEPIYHSSREAFLNLLARAGGLLEVHRDLGPPQHFGAPACSASVSPSRAGDPLQPEAMSFVFVFSRHKTSKSWTICWILSLRKKLQEGWVCVVHYCTHDIVSAP